MLCRGHFFAHEMLRVGREGDGTLRIGERGGRGLWICRGAHDADLHAAVRRGLGGAVPDEDMKQIEEARRAWIETEGERRGT